MTANSLSRQLLGAACLTLFCGLAAAKDKLLEHELPTPEYRKFSERWFSPDDKTRVRLFYPQMLKDAR